jgi:L-amino acid N-acyltransferase YncA
MRVKIRNACLEDADAIAEIYNHAIADGNATFDTFPVSGNRYASFFERDDRASLLVAVSKNQVVGWASISPISDRWAYRYTCLGSFFVHRRFRGKGVGNALKGAQTEEAARLGYHSLIVEVLSTNLISIRLNLTFGFRIVGESWEAGYRDGKWIGLVIMQKMLN